ncbi:MAG: hypothetical protein HRT66_09795 [Flavobacteriaceae bacterium]|nr:hypothetical protein [Flavobacteriaceae bacterium]
MKNLNKYKVEELNVNEIRETNGGCFTYDFGWLIRASFGASGAAGHNMGKYLAEYNVYHME